MNTETAKILRELNNGFYRTHCDSFSATRSAPWTGWKRCLELMADAGLRVQDGFSVLDLACGNLRFEEFLSRELPDVDITYYAVDDCDDLVPQRFGVHYQSLDVLDALLHGASLSDKLAAPACDLSVSFGFMHHLPISEHRAKVLSGLVSHTLPGGFVIVSFWQFAKHEGLRRKAEETHARTLEQLGLPSLDTGDYILGWKDIPGAFRYCHSFSEPEIDRLVGSVEGEASVVSRFVSDGRSDDLNSYVIFRVH